MEPKGDKLYIHKKDRKTKSSRSPKESIIAASQHFSYYYDTYEADGTVLIEPVQDISTKPPPYVFTGKDAAGNKIKITCTPV